MKRVQGADDPEDLISISQLMQVLGQEPDPASANGEPETTQRVPRITRMPPGVEVNESVLGRAVGRWVLQVRCDCGRRWFEVEALPTVHCPRCGTPVLLEIEER